MPHDPKHVEAIFSAALEKSDAERDAFLNAECGGDSALRQRLDALLRSNDEASGFLNTPAVAQIQPNAERTADLNDAPGSSRTDMEETQGEPADSRSAAGTSLTFLAPSSRDDSLGRLDHYEILRVLGKGGFGTVFKAFDEKLHRMVAIKVLAPELAASGTAKARFLREARAAAAVNHEHVVGTHAIGEAPTPYFVMEYIEGQTLQEKLDENGPLELKEILRIGLPIAEGLAAAHKHGLMHRDIKPGNILLENGVERVKIADFGLARAVDDASVTQSGVVAGTPTYMSPEQAEGLTLDQRSDLFSLGTVLYVMCTGRPPFRASGTMAVLKRVIEETARPIREVNPEMPQCLCDIVEKLHAKNPKDRYQSAKEVAELLAKYLTQIQLHGHVASPPVLVQTSPVASALEVSHATPPNKSRRTKVLLRWGTIALAASVVVAVLISQLYPWPATLHIGGGGHFYDYTIVVEGDNYPARSLRLDKNWKGIAGHELKLPAGTYRVKATMNDVLLYITEVTVKSGQRSSVIVPVVEGILELDNAGGESVRIESRGMSLTIDNQQAFKLPVGFYRWRVQVESGRTTRQGEFFLPPEASERYKLRIPSQSEEGWVQLFDGQTLAGWKVQPAETKDWKVQNGILIGESHGSFLVSERDDYENFHLSVEARIHAGGDSGMYFRCQPDLALPRGVRSGYEAQIVAPGPFTSRTGSLMKFVDGQTLDVNLIDQKLIQAGTWFIHEVIANGSHITIKVNDKIVVDYKDEQRPHRKGHVAFDLYKQDSRVEFQTIEIRELPPSTPEVPRRTAEVLPSPPRAVAPFNADNAKNLQDAWATHLGVEPEITNSIGMKLRLIPPGEFTRGTDSVELASLFKQVQVPHETGWFESEAPAKRTIIDAPFYMGVHEVTIGQFKAFIDKSKYQTQDEASGKGGSVWEDGRIVRKPEYTWRRHAQKHSANHPVAQITLVDAQEFCAWLSRVENRQYVIPREDQWEFACRAGTTSRWHHGDDEAGLDAVAWFRGNSDRNLQPVGGRLPNAFGLHDMHGNIEELCVSALGWPYGRSGGGRRSRASLSFRGAPSSYGPRRFVRRSGFPRCPHWRSKSKQEARTPAAAARSRVEPDVQ